MGDDNKSDGQSRVDLNSTSTVKDESDSETISTLKKSLSAEKKILDYAVDNLNSNLSSEPADEALVEAQLEVCREQMESYNRIQDSLLDNLLHKDDDGEFLKAKLEAASTRQRFTRMEVHAKRLLTRKRMAENDDVYSILSQSHGAGGRGRKLPKLELPKFDGDIRGWLPYWSQFEDIHTDSAISDSDKYQYLIQSTVDGSEARCIVMSFPICGKNYQLAIDALQKRFGREKLLVKVYVRDLLNMVIENSQSKRVPLSTLHVQLSAKIRALATLGVTTEKCAAVVYPLVESCLPADLLRAWQRDPVYKQTQDEDKSEELDKLLEFLDKEVAAEVNSKLACQALQPEKDHGRKQIVKKVFGNIPTASGLLVTQSSKEGKLSVCIFCGKQNHVSHECRIAAVMSYGERRNCIQNKRACYTCLRIGHGAKNCKAYVKCRTCSRRHRTIMCPETNSKQNSPKSDNQLVRVNNGNELTKRNSNLASMSNGVQTTNVLLQTIVVNVSGENGLLTARALIDTGSQRSYITKHFAEQLGLRKIGEEEVVYSLFGGTRARKRHSRYTLSITSINDSYRFQCDVSDVERISGEISMVPVGAWINELQRYNVVLSDVGNQKSEVQILFGADIAGKLLTGSKIELESGPIAIETSLGWTLMGEVPQSEICINNNQLVSTLLSCEKDIFKLWELETLGITDPVEKRTRQELEQSAMEHFKNTVGRNGEGRYEVNLPWIEGHRTLPTNQYIAERRLRSTTDALQRNDTINKYDALFRMWEGAGFIEEVPDNEVAEVQCHYLPHRAVYKPTSLTTPIRPVFDASSKAKEYPSLNDCMEKGPNLLEKIPTIITRFRLNKIGVTADILKAFQQISVAEKDRNFLRFLWWKDLSCKKLKIYRHCRVVFGVSSSPFLLGVTLQHIMDNAPAELVNTANILSNSMYVDNLVASVGSIEEAEKLKEDADKLLLPVKFTLRDYEIGPRVDAKEVSLLGLLWEVKKDILKIDISAVQKKMSLPITKRQILSLAQMVFDPIGFTCPYPITPKKMLQQIWLLKIGWDIVLPDELVKKFRSWEKQLLLLNEIEVPRYIQGCYRNEDKRTLHVFTDASKDAYAAAVFIRIENENVSVQLLQAKSRVAPLKPTSIPRLELLACVIGARMADSVKIMICDPVIETTYWSDNSSALYWIKTIGNWGVFVQRRVDEIRKLSAIGDWRHVPGDYNPADLPSRGCSAEVLIRSKWWEGPEWLKKEEKSWPVSSVIINEEEVNSELKKTVVSAMSHEQNHELRIIEGLSSYKDMLEAAAHVLKTGNVPESPHASEILAGDLKSAEIQLVKMIQQSSFEGISDVRFKQLNGFEDERGCLRLRTRLLLGDFEDDFKTPLILPSKGPVVEALIQYEHEKNSHAGAQTLTSILRERFWILHARRSIRGVITKCQDCRRYEARKLKCDTPALPRQRLHAETPFQVTGVDYFGPLFMKDGTKAWVALFTCAVYRAVHLELVTSMTTEAFISALRRFVSRRGRPDTIFSDNGSNFVGCNNLFKDIDWKQVERYGVFRRIEWRFNPPTAAWWGGWWERLVGVVKKSLRRVLGKSILTFEEMQTILCDVEAIVNQRPLTYVSEDPKDLTPLSPHLFIVGNKTSQIPEADLLDGRSLRSRLKFLQRVRAELRSRFRKEYLGQLRCWGLSKESRKVKVGDVVLVGHDNMKRMDWPLGTILRLFPGKDGQVRVVKVKTDAGELLRPIQRIYPMEASSEPATAEASLLENIAEQQGEPEPDRRVEVVTRSGRRVKIPKRLTMITFNSREITS